MSMTGNGVTIPCGGQRHGDGSSSRGREKPARSRGAQLRNDVKTLRTGGGVADLTFQVHKQLSVQLGGTALCFDQEDSAILIGMQDADRAFKNKVVHSPDKERANPHIWFFMAMLKATEEALKPKIGVQSPRGGNRGLDGARTECMGESVQASPNLRKAWSSAQVADYLRRGRSHLPQTEEAGRRGGPAGSSIGAVGGGHDSARRIRGGQRFKT